LMEDRTIFRELMKYYNGSLNYVDTMRKSTPVMGNEIVTFANRG